MRSKNKKNAALILSGKKADAALLEGILEGAGLKTVEFYSPSALLSHVLSAVADLVFISRETEGISSRDLALVLRKNPKTEKMLIIFFSRGRESVSADFDSGIDEYFDLDADSPQFIKTRVLNLLARRPAGEEPPPPAVFGEIELETVSRSVRVGGREIILANLEFEILVYFLRNRNRVITRNSIMEAVWKDPFAATLRSVDKRIEVLRKKLGAAGRHIQTVFAVGYVFK